jgi:hypothetical protein
MAKSCILVLLTHLNQPTNSPHLPTYLVLTYLPMTNYMMMLTTNEGIAHGTSRYKSALLVYEPIIH